MEAHPAVAEPSQLFGQGEFPASLDRLNWGAVLMSALWALAYGMWPISLLFLALRFGAVVLLGVLRATLASSPSLAIAMAVGIEVVTWVVLGVFGLRANRLAWQRHGARLGGRDSQPQSRPLTVEGYLTNQTIWVRVGIIFTITGTAYGLYEVANSASRQLAPALAGTACALLAVGVLWGL
ncbi:MAG: hypothetical protein U1E22_08670, partial [Coriobacteriia bacterium]|nr:hypothetical protein [Coriobacteriia bacterium]